MDNREGGVILKFKYCGIKAHERPLAHNTIYLIYIYIYIEKHGICICIYIHIFITIFIYGEKNLLSIVIVSIELVHSRGAPREGWKGCH